MEDQSLNCYVDHFEQKFTISRPRYTRSDLIANVDYERVDRSCNFAEDVSIKEQVSHSVESTPVAAMKANPADGNDAMKDQAFYTNETFPGVDRFENFLLDSDIHKDKVIVKARDFVEGEVVHQETIEILLKTQKNIEVDIDEMQADDKAKETATTSLYINPEKNIEKSLQKMQAGGRDTSPAVRNLALSHKFGTEADLRIKDIKSAKTVEVGISPRQAGSSDTPNASKSLAFTPKLRTEAELGVNTLRSEKNIESSVGLKQVGGMDTSTESKNLSYTPKLRTETELGIKNLKSEKAIGVGVDSRQAGGLDTSTESKNLQYTSKFGTEAELEVKKLTSEKTVGIGIDSRQAGGMDTSIESKNLTYTPKFGTEAELEIKKLTSEKTVGVGIDPRQAGGIDTSTELKNLSYAPPRFGTEAELEVKNLKSEKTVGVGVDSRQAGGMDTSIESKNLAYTPRFGTEAELEIKNLKSEKTVGVGVDSRQAGGIDASIETKNLSYTPKFGTEAELEMKARGFGADLKTKVYESNFDSCKEIPKWNFGEENKIETPVTQGQTFDHKGRPMVDQKFNLTSTNISQSIAKAILLRRKFQFDNFDLEKLVQAKGVEISEESFEDVYYDTKFYDLILSDSWLRMRNGKWELKLPETDDKAKLYTCNYMQVEKENEIQKALKKWPHLGTATKENKTFLEEFQLKPFAEFSSVRKTYQLPMDYMVVVEFSRFGFNVAVIEKKIEYEGDICEATKNINNLANQFGFQKLSLLDLVEQAEAY